MLIARSSCPHCGGDVMLDYKGKMTKCIKCSRIHVQPVLTTKVESH